MPASALPPLLGAPAPVELMNTRWMRRGRHLDAIDSVEGLRAWALRAGLHAEGAEAPDADELAEWRLLRDALRAITAEAVADPRTEPARMPLDEATDTLNRALEGQREARRLAWSDGRPAFGRSVGDCWQAARGRIAVEALEILTDPAHRIRPCLAPNCPLFFMQTRPDRHWCSDACGNRARVARHAARRP